MQKKENDFHMPGDDILILRGSDLWCHLKEQDFEGLNVHHKFIEASKGEYIYFEAHNHNKLYFLQEGNIKIGFIDDDGNEQIKEIVQKGDMFGQFTLEPGNLNGEFAQAYNNDVSLCSFNVADFEKLLKSHPDLGLKFSKQVGSKLRKIETKLLSLLSKNVRERLIGFLWQLAAQDPGAATGNSLCIPNFLTHGDIAALIGSSRQTVSTLIGLLETEGIVSVDRQEIRFPDLKKLRAMALG